MDGEFRRVPSGELNLQHISSEQTKLSVSDVSTLRLAMLPGVGPRTMSRLLEAFGDATSVFGASSDQLGVVEGVGKQLAQKIRNADDYVDVDKVASWCAANAVQFIFRGAANYPRPLNDLYDAPAVLFAKGSVVASDRLSVAIVGTRHGTAYGTRQAERMAYGLAKAGVAVVSGLARGIDAAAHRGALQGGGRTLAFLGSGLGEIYPAEHVGLANEVSQSGAVLSEFPPYMKPRAGLFPQRNRLIAAMSAATLVIEAPQRSGALITAHLAGELGRDVLGLPGPVTGRASQGVNSLIRDGAILVQTVDDVLESLGPLAETVSTRDGHQVRHPAELRLNDVERQVLEAVPEDGVLIDNVIQASELPAHRVMATIGVLEMRRLVRRLPGQKIARA